MVWPSVIIILLGVAQLASGRDLLHSGNPSYLVRRSTITGGIDADGIQDEDEGSDNVFNGPILYNHQENLRHAFPPESSPPDFLQRNFLADNGRAFLRDEQEPFVLFREQADTRPISEQQQNEAILTDELSATNSNSTPLRDYLSPEDKFFLQKRLQMNGMGLIGSTNGQKSLIGGLAKSQPKGMVLSIDLGIKALRDAIMHAKVQQKNRQHKVQAQKNLRLLHNIGKRRVVHSTPVRDDRP